MRVLAPAKINLHLRVGPRREDGFHPLLTWMATIALFDTLTFVRRRPDATPVAPDSESWFSLTCSDPGLPTDGSNLVTRAARALADALSGNGEGSAAWREGVSAYLTKRIPHGAGLGGGSSDAAATLLALDALWKQNSAIERLNSVAAQLGSDVPFFLHGPSSVCLSRGEVVRPIAAPGTKWVILVTPAMAVATPAVYRRFDEMGLGQEEVIRDEPDWSSWTMLSSQELMPQLVNDLEPAAFALHPELGELRTKLEDELSQVVRMSGSGSSLFSLCDDARDAESKASRVRGRLGVGAMAVQLAPQQAKG